MTRRGGWIIAFAAALASSPLSAEDAPGNRFVYTQIRHNADWDPYPAVWESLQVFVRQSTSVDPWPDRRVITLDDPRLFESPCVVLMGRGAVAFTDAQKDRLRDFLSGGGVLLIDDSEGERNGPFARSVLPALDGLFPGSSWRPVPSDDAVFRSFFLLNAASGRRLADAQFKGLWVQDRLAAVYCANDLHGAWARDQLGNYLYACEPGGDLQRRNAMKLTVNLLIFSMTGTYKTDAIHQPFIEQKLRR